VVLRGGSEAIQSNAAIVRVLIEAGEKAGLYAYLVKGCAPDVLWRTIRFALNSQAKR